MLAGFEPGIESSGHLESTALTTTLSRKDTRSGGMQRVNSGLDRDKCKSTRGIRTRDIKSARLMGERSVGVERLYDGLCKHYMSLITVRFTLPNPSTKTDL